MKELLEVGVQVFFHSLIHAKSLLIDEKDGFIFTANFTENGLDKGLEVGVKLNKQQTADLAKIHHNWKANFQSKAILTAKVKDLKEIEIFKDGKLTKKMLLDESKEDKRKLNKVSDLLSFFNQKFELNDNAVKSRKYKLTAEIDDLPKNIKTNGADKFEVIDITESKGRQSKIVVLKDDFKTEDIQQLNDLKDHRLYFA